MFLPLACRFLVAVDCVCMYIRCLYTLSMYVCYGMFIDNNEQKELDQESWLEENNPHWGKSQACR